MEEGSFKTGKAVEKGLQGLRGQETLGAVGRVGIEAQNLGDDGGDSQEVDQHRLDPTGEIVIDS